MRRGPFFGSIEMEIFYRKKAFHDFAPSEKFSYYAPASLSHLEALDLDVTSYALNNCSF